MLRKVFSICARHLAGIPGIRGCGARGFYDQTEGKVGSFTIENE